MALVLVLFVLVLTTALVVGFLSLVSTERQASSSYSDDSRTRQLADAAVNMVIGQIRQATDTLNDDPTAPKTWASQPGMIRVYGITDRNNIGRADLTRAYKLYSSDQMVVSTFGTPEANSEVPPTDWNTKPALYTDLNAPVQVTDPANPASTKQRFPIFDPGALGTIPGMDVVNAPGATTGQPAPMPVKWLYLLKDGTCVAAQEIPGNTYQVRVAGATDTNPIVGRLAFWTDDECAKVNINTASEGVFWDTPKANTATERKYGSYLPARNEFQRYPGHPATVCLSPVLGGYFTNTTGNTSAGTSAFGLYYDLAPRVQTGGSLDGTRRPVDANGNGLNITMDQDRLYASVDEYFFKSSSMTNGVRDANTTQFTSDVLAQTEFFLTAQSRAPEVTLFNTPRVCLWPLQVVQPSGTTTARNTYDKLIAFCTSLGTDPSLPTNYPSDQSRGYPYYYQRLQPVQVLSVTQKNPSCYSPTADYNNVPRNQAIYAYLQSLTSKNIPGFGGNFLAKYPNDRDQLLTECFDYTRSLVNAIPTPRNNLTPYYSYGPFYYDFGAIAPIQIGNTQGQGRSVTISQAAVIFYPTEIDATNPTNLQTTKMRARLFLQPYCVSPGASAFNQRYSLRANGMNGFMADGASLQFPLVNNGSVNGIRAVNFNEGYYTADSIGPANKTAYPSPAGQFFYYKSGFGGNLYGAGHANGQFDIWASTGDINVAGKQTFVFTGGPVTIDVYSPDGTVVQTLQINFPSQTLPVPKRVAPLNDVGKTLVGPNLYQTDYYARFNGSLPTNGSKVDVSGILMKNLIYPGDTVYAMSVNAADKTHGDMRLIAYRQGVGTDTKDPNRTQYFAPETSYNGACLRTGYWANNGAQFRSSWTTYFNNTGAGGKLVTGLNYPVDSVPAVPAGLNAATNQYGAPGDWDSGYDIVEDGPYVNKADEGSTTLGYFTRGNGLGFVGAGGEGGGSTSQGSETDNITYSPNRQIASAVMFGSLPTGVIGKDASKAKPEPWQTLLFNPNPAGGRQHYGFKFPQDHLWLDLFWMPIVEPYAISEPFSTAGKINMNYDIMPFRYLKRRTALQAVLKGTRMTGIPDSDVGVYKKQPAGNSTNATTDEYRFDIDPDPTAGTLKGFEDRFNAGDIFHSASEICTISLVPKGGGATYDNMSSWWQTRRLTGDNLRESPYNQLYPRLTTKSNTYTVHVRVQSLKKNRAAGSVDVWDQLHDFVAGEYRGSCLIERYIDPNSPDLPDFTSSQDTNGNGIPDNRETLDPYYTFRVIQRRQFAP